MIRFASIFQKGIWLLDDWTWLLFLVVIDDILLQVSILLFLLDVAWMWRFFHRAGEYRRLSTNTSSRSAGIWSIAKTGYCRVSIYSITIIISTETIPPPPPPGSKIHCHSSKYCQIHLHRHISSIDLSVTKLSLPSQSTIRYISADQSFWFSWYFAWWWWDLEFRVGIKRGGDVSGFLCLSCGFGVGSVSLLVGLREMASLIFLVRFFILFICLSFGFWGCKIQWYQSMSMRHCSL